MNNTKNIALIILLVVIISFITTKFSASNQGSFDSSVYNNVVSSGKIKACYVVYPPASIKDPNTGEISGVFVETLNKASENMGLEIEWGPEVGWGEMIESLNTGKCDIVGSPAWSNSTRGRSAEFSIPLYYSAINAYGRINENRISSVFDINNPEFTIATIDGESSQVIAKNQFPNAETLELPQLTDVGQMLLNVTTGKADVAFLEPVKANNYTKNNPNSIKNLSPEKPVVVYGNVMLIKKGEFEFKAMIDNALEELINNGFVDSLINRYESEYPGGFYRVAPKYNIPNN